MQIARGCAAFALGLAIAGCSGGGSAPGSPQTIGPEAAAPATTPSPIPTAPPAKDALGTVTVTAVEAGRSSVKIDVLPYQSARDYRVYDVSEPNRIKYAGLVYPRSHRLPLVPSTQIEWNGLEPARPATLIVEALDRLGPFPPGALSVFNPPLPASCASAGATRRDDAGSPGSALRAPGSNLGLAGGAIAINGRGCPSSIPKVIARSAPFVVNASGAAPLPSSAFTRSAFFDGFAASEASTLRPIVAADLAAGRSTYTFGNPPNTWTVLVDNADIADTKLAIAGGEFTDVLFDGATPASKERLHDAHASVALVPNADADLSGGAILHATLEVDSHVDARRWFGIDLAPATDPFTSLTGDDGAIDRTDTGLFVGVSGSGEGAIGIDEFTGPKYARTVNSPPSGTRVVGLQGQSLHSAGRAVNDLGLDNRERWDLFVSQTRVALFEDGQRVCDDDLPAALPFGIAKLYFVHHLDRSASELASLKASAPQEDYWIEFVPYSDARHWSNMGFEVLPPGVSWRGLAGHVHLPAARAPVFVTQPD